MYPFIDLGIIKIPTYGVCLCSAILLCGFLYIKRGKTFSLCFEDMIITAAVTVASGILGGGALYIAVTYSFEELYCYIKNFDFSFVTNGGLVFYGALIGGISGAVISCKMLKVEISLVEKSAVPLLPLGHAIGRFGCMLAGCCRGFEYNGILAVKCFLDGKTYFPVQIAESILNLIIMSILLWKINVRNNILRNYLIMYSVMRFFLEFFRGDEIRGGFAGYSTSQWISLGIFAFCIIWKYGGRKFTVRQVELKKQKKRRIE